MPARVGFGRNELITASLGLTEAENLASKELAMNLLSTATNALLLHLGSGMGTLCRYDWRRKAHDGRRYSEKLLLRLVKKNRGTEFGRAYHFDCIKSVRDYQDIVPLTTYEDYKDYIDRMLINGEQRLITKSKARFYAVSSGTTSYVKYLPQTLASLIPYVKLVLCVATDLCTSLNDCGVGSFSAKGIMVTEVSQKPASEELAGHAKARTPTGAVSSYATGALKLLFPLFTPLPLLLVGNDEIVNLKHFKALFCLQDRNLKFFGATYMSFLMDLVTYIQENHDMLIRDMETGTIDQSIELSDDVRRKLERRMKPNPKRAAELRHIFQNDSDIPLISRIWKNMSLVCAVGTGDFALSAQRMRALCLEDVRFSNSMYAASEAFMGAAMSVNTTHYLLVPDSGFYEFIPVPEECPEMPERPLLAHELEVGKHYELILTSLAGLYRYRLNDVIQVVGYEGEFPYIEFAYRSSFCTDICASHVTMGQLAQSVRAAEETVDVSIEEYSLYGDGEHMKPRLELFLETDRMLTSQELARMTQAFQEKLLEVGYDYADSWNRGLMDLPALRCVAKNTYIRHRDEQITKGASGNQLKTLRAIRKPEDLAFFRAAVITPEAYCEQA